MKKTKSGFTLIELMIVIAIIAIIAAIAIPNLLESKKLSNERACFPTIKSIGTAQALFREKEQLDADADGIGEFAMSFAHLGGVGTVTATPVLGMVPTVADVTMSEKSGYIFQLFIPTVDGAGVVDDDETAWSCAAWPKKWDKTGNTCYFMAEDNIAYEKKQPNTAAMMFDGTTAPVLITDVYGTAFDNATVLTGAGLFVAKK